MCVDVCGYVCGCVCGGEGGCFGHSHVSESVKSTDPIPADEAHIFCQI